MNYCIIITFHIRTYAQTPTFIELSEVISFVKLMIARYYYHLLKILRSPIPERMFEKTFIPQIASITCQHQDVSYRLNRIILQVASILYKLQM